MSKHAEAGFTLLEMLVVLVLVGVLAGVAVLSLPGDPRRVAQQEAELLQQTLQMAADTAVYQGQELGAYFTQGGYGFLHYDNKTRQWLESDNKALKPHLLPKEIALQFTLTGKMLALPEAREAQAKPALVFLSSGEMTAFSAVLTNRVQASSASVSGDGLNPVQVKAGTP